METHGAHFQEMDDIAGKILVNVVLTVALENVFVILLETIQKEHYWLTNT